MLTPVPVEVLLLLHDARREVVRATGLVLPGFVRAARANRRVARIELAARMDHWRRVLLDHPSVGLDAKREMLAQAYAASSARAGTLEQKGVGLLQGCALVVAGLVLVVDMYPHDAGVGLAVVTAVSVAYLVFSVASALRVVMPQARVQITAEDCADQDKGACAFAVGTEDINLATIRISNWVRAAATDLVRSGLALLFALAAVRLYGA